MRHCVGSYASKCLRGGTSIWSLRQVQSEQIKRLVTIEVSPKGQIVQARKKLNAAPEKWQWSLIRQWAKREHLGIN